MQSFTFAWRPGLSSNFPPDTVKKKRSPDLQHSLLVIDQLGLQEGKHFNVTKATSLKEEEQSKMENLPDKMLTELMVRLFTFFTLQHFPAEYKAPVKYGSPVVAIYLAIKQGLQTVWW